jgi:hypothetical protein
MIFANVLFLLTLLHSFKKIKQIKICFKKTIVPIVPYVLIVPKISMCVGILGT